jgi:hypothetical protein
MVKYPEYLESALFGFTELFMVAKREIDGVDCIPLLGYCSIPVAGSGMARKKDYEINILSQLPLPYVKSQKMQ